MNLAANHRSLAKTDHDVVIAGAGPTGLMLAAELALAGIDVAIVERRTGQEVLALLQHLRGWPAACPVSSRARKRLWLSDCDPPPSEGLDVRRDRNAVDGDSGLDRRPLCRGRRDDGWRREAGAGWL